MHKENDPYHLLDWSEEIGDVLLKSKSFYVALFSTDKRLIYSNDAFSSLMSGDPCSTFINPSFDDLLAMDVSSRMVFNGYLTIGDYRSENNSIFAQIFRKKNKLLVIGGVDIEQLLVQNSTMHQLNREVIDLQRDLIRKKQRLENTLSQLQEVNNELKKMNADMNRFIQILGHDLRSPFTTLLGFSDLLLENLHSYDIERIENLISIINKTSHQTFKLLEELLLWSKAHANRVPFEPRHIAFRSVCQQVVEGLWSNAVSKNIKISIQQIDENLMVFVDEHMLKTILRNLISNAIKFTQRNGEINIRIDCDQAFTVITVTDNGVGIARDQINKLWDMTQHYTTEGTASEKGTGLGLLLCKEFVEKHGGRIWVDSELGKGSSFRFVLPRKEDVTLE
jgi:signal transduction histidine kinase